MVVKNIKEIFISNVMLKAMSLIIGYIFWIILSQNIVITKEVILPLCFYNKQKDILLDAPEYINAKIQSTKSILSNIDNIAFFINLNNLKLGENIITLSKENLYTPNINLVEYSPKQVLINISKAKNEEPI